MSKTWTKDDRFGKYLREKIAAAGTTLNTTAREIGVTSSYISDVAAGNRGPFKGSVLIQLSEYLKLSQEEKDQMFDLEGMVKESVPSDVQGSLKDSPMWVGIIRRFNGLSDENKQKLMETLLDELQTLENDKVR